MNKKFIATLSTALTLSGCSVFERLSTETEKKPTTEPVKFSFQAPRREAIGIETSKKLSEQIALKTNGFSYYSASGYQCKTLSVTPLRSACYINQQWLAAPAILMNNSTR